MKICKKHHKLTTMLVFLVFVLGLFGCDKQGPIAPDSSVSTSSTKRASREIKILKTRTPNSLKKFFVNEHWIDAQAGGEIVVGDSAHGISSLHFPPNFVDQNSVSEFGFSSWGRKCELVIQASQVPGDLTDFPVLLTEATLPSEMFDADGSYPALDGGGDIRFSSDPTGSDRLSCEIVRFTTDNDPANGKAEIWVKVPSVSSVSNPSIWVWYNNPGQSQPGPAEPYGSQSVWSNGYEAVLHLQESGNGSDNEFKDATSNAHHGTGGGLAGSGDPNKTPSRVIGKFGYAQNFDDSGSSSTADLIRLNQVHDSTWTAITVQAWVKVEDNGDDRIFVKSWNEGSCAIVWNLAIDGNMKISHRSDTDSTWIGGGDIFSVGSWVHFVYTWDANAGGVIKAYQNGQLKLSEVMGGTTLYNHSIEPTIGNSPNGNSGFDGNILECRLSHVARRGEWLQAEYNNQNDPSSFVIAGTPGTQGLGLLVNFHWESEDLLEVELESSPPGINFTQPVRVKLSYKDADLTGINEEDLAIWYYHESEDIWELVGDFVNTQEKFVEGYLYHFSRYAVGWSE